MPCDRQGCPAHQRLGRDPEYDGDRQVLVDVRWTRLDQLSERDRALLWTAGLLGVGPFGEMVLGWGGAISYPADGADQGR